MHFLIGSLIATSILTFFSHQYIILIDLYRKNFGKKSYVLKSVFKLLIVRSFKKIVLYKPFEEYESRKEIYVTDPIMKNSVSSFALLLQILCHIYTTAIIVLLVLEIIDPIFGFIGFLLSCGYILVAIVLGVTYLYHIGKMDEILLDDKNIQPLDNASNPEELYNE